MVQESVIAEDFASSSIQHGKGKNAYIFNDEIVVPNSVFRNLIDNLEGFGKHFEKVCKKFEEDISSQSHLIESLSTRMDYLEIDSKAKDQEIKRLRKLIQVTQDTTITANENFQYNEPLKVESYENLQNKKTMKCKKCGKKFKSFTRFQEHSKERHHYKCMICLEVFQSKKSRKKHMKKKHQKNFACTSCSYKSYFATGLKEHFRAKHFDETAVPGTSIQFLHEIIPYQLPSDKVPSYQLKCKVCEKIFDTHLLFNKHIKSLHGHKFSCPECSKVFSEKSLYRQHMKRVYTCKVCNKKVIGEGGLISHCKAKNHQLNLEEIILKGVQISTSQGSTSTRELSELKECTAEVNGSFDDNYNYDDDNDNDNDNDAEEENEGSDDDDYTEEENEGSDDDDYTEEENEESDDESIE